MTMRNTYSEPECVYHGRVSDGEQARRPRRKLIDYTLTNGRKQALASAPTSPSRSSSGDSRPPLRKELISSSRSVNSIESRRFVRGDDSSQSQEEERVEFWLRIPSSRAPRSEKRIQDILETFPSKSKKRSQKSTLFGSLSGRTRELRHRKDASAEAEDRGIR